MIIHININAVFPLAFGLAYNTYLCFIMTGSGTAGLGGVMPVPESGQQLNLPPALAVKLWSAANSSKLPGMLPAVIRSTFLLAAAYLLAALFTSSTAVYNLSITAALVALVPIPYAIGLILPYAFPLLALSGRPTVTEPEEREIEYHMNLWSVAIQALIFIHMASWLAGALALVWVLVAWLASWFW